MDNLLNKKYNIELEVLTPLHIGAGAEKDWMKGADYISDKGNVFVLNHREISRQLSANELSNYLLKKDDVGLKNKLSDKLKDVSDLIFKEPSKSDNDIKTFIKNGLTNKPIVPGSSIKGAIRSILFSYLKEKYQKNDKQVFGSPDEGDEFMRFIKIADAQFEKTELVNTKIFNLYGIPPNFNGGWKHEFRGSTNNKFKPTGFNTIYEIISPKETGELSIALSDKAFVNFYKKNQPEKKSKILHQELTQKLFAIINDHTKKYIDKQIAFFDKYSNNETDKIIVSLREVRRQIPSDNSSCVLQMSAGSGFHSITGDWQFDDFSIDGVASGRVSRGQLNRKDSAKSRKIATDGKTFDLMGFVKLSILTDEIIAERETKKKEKLEAEIKEKAVRVARENAEKERIKAEKQAKLELEQKEEAVRVAKEKAEREAKEKLLKEQADALVKAQEANKDRRALETQHIMLEGLSSLDKLNEFKSGKKSIENYFKVLGELITDEQQLSVLKDFISRCILKSNKRWKKEGKQDWVLVKKWVGQETAQQWYNELTK